MTKNFEFHFDFGSPASYLAWTQLPVLQADTGALAKAGFDPAALLALANEQAVKDQLKAATQEAVARGVFGAPTFFVGDQLFWGQDRIEWVREALA